MEGEDHIHASGHYPQNQKKIMGCSATLVKLVWCYFSFSLFQTLQLWL